MQVRHFIIPPVKSKISSFRFVETPLHYGGYQQLRQSQIHHLSLSSLCKIWRWWECLGFCFTRTSCSLHFVFIRFCPRYHVPALSLRTSQNPLEPIIKLRFIGFATRYHKLISLNLEMVGVEPTSKTAPGEYLQAQIFIF